jgi:hypothetical protein
MASNLILWRSIASATSEVVTLTNGSRIINLPCSAETIRGFSHVTDILLNESAWGPTEELLNSLFPMQSLVLDPVFVLSSTPSGQTGLFWECWNSPAWTKLPVVPTSMNPYVPPGFLELQREAMSMDAYRSEYEAVFVSAQSFFFDEELIRSCIEDYEPGEGGRDESKRYVLGVDWGRTRDASVFSVLSVDEDENMKVELVKGFTGTPFTVQQAYIQYLHGLYRFGSIVSEYAGLGIGPTESLEGAGLPVERFVPTVAEKLRAYDAVKLAMEQSRLKVPASERTLILELRMLSFKVNPSGSISIHAPGASHDDQATSLALAVFGAQSIGSSLGLVDLEAMGIEI